MRIKLSKVGRQTSFYLLAGVLVFAGAFVSKPVSAQAATITLNSLQLITKGASGTGGNEVSDSPSINADGTEIAFVSSAVDLAPGIETDGSLQVYLYNTKTRVTILVSESPISHGGCDGSCNEATISADGTKIVFNSLADNLIPGVGSRKHLNLYLYDIKSKTITLVTPGSRGKGVNNDAYSSAINADGTKIAYASQFTDQSGYADDSLCLYDVRTKTTKVIVPDSASAPSISADGSKIAFASSATNLIPGMTTNNNSNIFLYDSADNTFTLITKGASGKGGNSGSMFAAISADGSKVAFSSQASDLVPGSRSNSHYNFYLHDIGSKKTTLITKGSSGKGGNADMTDVPSLSADGRVVAFDSPATDLISGTKSNIGYRQIYLYDALNQEIKLIAPSIDSKKGYILAPPMLSSNGTELVFSSEASDLIPRITANGNSQIYLASLTVPAVPQGTTAVSQSGSTGSMGSESTSATSTEAAGITGTHTAAPKASKNQSSLPTTGDVLKYVVPGVILVLVAAGVLIYFQRRKQRAQPRR